MRRVLAAIVFLWAMQFVHGLDPAGTGAAVGRAPSVNRSQVEGTVIHVDKHGVYIPNTIFYWDPGMSKQNLEALTKAAERLRNSRAIITYAATADLSLDRHPLLLDIIPSDEQTKRVALGDFPDRGNGEETQGTGGPSSSLPGDENGADAEGEEEVEEDEDYVTYSNLPPHPNTIDPDEGDREERGRPAGRDEVLRLIGRFLRANNSKDMDSVLSCYGRKVEYYDSGLVDREFIRRDKTLYFSSWDKIDFSLDSDVTFIVTDQQDIRIAKFEANFLVANRSRSINGRVENVWKIKRINQELKIVGERQRILVRQ